MKKIILMLLLILAIAGTKSFATDKKANPKAKKTMKCTMGSSCCKKTNNRAAMLKAKPAAKKA